MTRHIVSSFAATAALAVVSALPAAADCIPAATSGGAEKCCFTNPRFTGVCQVTPAEDETCADILAYLNNQASVGKTYCGNTKVRGGWAQVDCDESKSLDGENSTPLTID